MDAILTMPDGREVGYADYGPSDHTPLLWCHGGPGNRQEPLVFKRLFDQERFRLIGIDRPGYGRSTPQPGRTIGGWVPDALAVADVLGLPQFFALGVSTGGAYALALAALSDRLLGAVVCCGLSDMRWADGKAMMHIIHPMWNAPDREAAMAVVVEDFGHDGSRTLAQAGESGLASSDVALLADPAYGPLYAQTISDTFRQGPGGYADDRLADRDGWTTFDVKNITCPVTVVHGDSDTLVPVANGHYTASLVRGAQLHTFPGLGHFSVVCEVPAVLSEMRRAQPHAARV